MTEVTDAIVVRRTIAAPAARIFRAFTTPELLARWMSPVGHAEVEIEARVGGAMRVTMVGGDVRIEHVGEFLELKPPHRLAFTWRSEHTGNVDTRVTVELVDANDGASTEVILRHELLSPPARESHAGGWGAMLDRLAKEVTHGA